MPLPGTSYVPWVLRKGLWKRLFWLWWNRRIVDWYFRKAHERFRDNMTTWQHDNMTTSGRKNEQLAAQFFWMWLEFVTQYGEWTFKQRAKVEWVHFSQRAHLAIDSNECFLSLLEKNRTSVYEWRHRYKNKTLLSLITSSHLSINGRF